MKTNMQKMRSYMTLGLIVLFAGTSFQASAQHVSVSFQVFYNELQPYGSWFNHADYGYVWAPDVGDFTPYATNGYWSVTQYGNTWVSNYDWGWAPFHYGRWHLDNFYGWIWVPDTVWSPAWVVWRNGGGYYGWAPMSPGLHFSLSFNLFNRIPNNYWTFCSEQYVWNSSWHSYCAPRNRNAYIVNNTTYINNYYVDNSNHYYSGPSHHDYQRATGRAVQVHQVEECNRPGQYRIDRDKIMVYRPSVSQINSDKPRVEHDPRGGGSHLGWNGSRGNNDGGNGHGDHDTPGNSDGHNKGENSENDGQGNGSHGNSGKIQSSYSGAFPGERGRIDLPSRKGNSNWSNDRGFEQNTPNQTNDRNIERSQPMMPARKVDGKREPAMSFPGRSGGSRESSGMKTPGRSNGNSGMSMPGRSGGSSRMSPSGSGGSKGGGGMKVPSHPGGSKGSSPRKK